MAQKQMAWAPKVLADRDPAEHEAILFTPEEVAPPPSMRPARDSRGRVSGAAVRALEMEPGGASTEGRPSCHEERASKRAAAEAEERRADSTAKMRLVLVLRRYERQWAELSDSQRDAARELGWDAMGWDAGDLRPCRDSRWRYLTQRQREAAEELLFCGRTWELGAAEADRQARRPLKTAPLGAKKLPVSSWALGMQDRMTLDELYATTGRVIGFRNMPGVQPAEILQVMRPLLTGHNQNMYELRSAFRKFDPDGDGVVSPPELRTALFSLGIELNAQQVLDLMSTMGGDAADTAVDYLQFARLLAPKRSRDLQHTATQLKAVLQTLNISLAESFRDFVHGDGYISRRELRAGLFALNAGLTMLQIDDLVYLADSEHTGKIDFHAFQRKLGCVNNGTTCSVARTKADLRATFHRRGVNLREAFEAFDKDRDGVISHYELASGLRQLDFRLSAMQVDDVLSSMDMDGDGSINYHEFARYFGTPADDRLLLQNVRDEVRALLRRNRLVGGWDRVLAAFEATTDGWVTKQAFQHGWIRAGLNLTERQLDCAFLSLGPNERVCVHIDAFVQKFGHASALSSSRMRALANKVCDHVRRAKFDPHVAFGLCADSSRPRKATFSPQEIRSALHKMRAMFPVHDVDTIIDVLDPDGQSRITSKRLTAFLHALAVYGVSCEILLQLREKIRASSEQRGRNRNQEWLTPSELSVVLASVNCNVRTETIARMVGSTTDEYGRISLGAFLNEMKRVHFIMQDCIDNVKGKSKRSGLANLAYEVRRRVMHAFNSELVPNGARSEGGEILLDAAALKIACKGLNITVASSRIDAFCMLGKNRKLIDGVLLSPSIVCPSSNMSRSAAVLIDEIDLLVDATRVDAWTLYAALDRNQQNYIALRNFIPAALQLGVEMTHTEIQDAWSMLVKGVMTREVFVHHFGQHDQARKTARAFSIFLNQSRLTSYDIFSKVDVHRTGHVLPDDLLYAVQALSTNIPEDDLVEAIEKVKLDKQGMITFAAFAMRFGILRSTAALVRKAFRTRHGGLSLGVLALYDHDRKGWISRSQAMAMLADLGLGPEMDGYDEFLHAIDQSLDGRIQIDTILSTVGAAKSPWMQSSSCAVRTFREEIAKVMKRTTGDARELFRLFCHVHEDASITRSSFFDGIREQRMAMEPVLTNAVFSVAATADTTARDAQKHITFVGFKMLCGQALKEDQHSMNKSQDHPGQIPASVAPPLKTIPETVKTKTPTFGDRERQQYNLQNVLGRHLRGVRLNDAWLSFDRDKDGRISTQEFIDGLVSLKVDLPEARIKDIVTFMDASSEGRVDWVEFMRLFGDTTDEDKSRVLLELTGIFREHSVDLHRTFESLDRYGDGRVLVEELCAGLGLFLSEQQRCDLSWVLGGTTVSSDREPRYIHIADFNRLLALPVASQQLSRAGTPKASVKAVADHLKTLMRHNSIPIREAFSSFDQDGDGIISRSEFSSALRKLNIGLSATQIDDVLSYIDKDGDGQISYFEFVRQFGVIPDHPTYATATGHVSMNEMSAVDDVHSRPPSNEVAAVEHVLNQLAQEFGLFDDAKTRVSAAIHAGVLDPRHLCSLLDRTDRGFLVRSDFTRTDLDWAPQFSLAASDLSDLAQVLDFGVDDRLAHRDFFAQLGIGPNVYTEYGRSRRRTGENEKFVSGPELEVTPHELAETLSRHQISAEQIALDLGMALDAYVSWEHIFDALENMGVQLSAPMRRSFARIQGSDGSMASGVTLREFDGAFPKATVDTSAQKTREQECVDVVVDLMKNVYDLDLRADVFLGEDKISTATFRRRMNALLSSDLSPGVINVLTFAVGRHNREDVERPGGEVWIQDVQQRFTSSIKHGGDASGRFSRAKNEPLSVELIRRAVDSAASDDGICQLPHQHIECSTIQQWLHANHGRSKLRQRKFSLSEVGELVELDLSDNMIACRGAVLIARRLGGDRCLRRLLLASNRIGDDGAMQLALLVQGSQTLRLLDLAYNRISQKGIDALRKARAANPSNIIQIVLDGNCPAVTADGRGETKVEKVTSKLPVKESAVKAKSYRTRKTLLNVHRLGRRQMVL